MEKRKQGLASLPPERVTEIARMGGIIAHARGVAHQFTKEEAREAGRKGGRAHSKEHMREIGRLGGIKRWSKK